MRRLPPVARLLCASLAGGAAVALSLPLPAHAEARPVVGGELLAKPGVVASLVPGVPAPPAVKASSYVIADLDTGEVLAARNAHGRFAPASTLKTLTAVTFIPRLPATSMVKAKYADAAVDGTKVGVVPGYLYPVDSLFKAMLMMSANDAAMTVASAQQDLASGLRLMNERAAQLHAFDTVAKTPNGLDARGQSSSAYDLALISRAGLDMPAFRAYVSTRRDFFPAPHHKHYEIYTHDHLLLNYPGAFGVKNGYTVAAQASFVGAAERGGHRLIVALMHGEPELWKDAAHLLDWGFRADGAVLPVGRLVDPDPLPPVQQAAPAAGKTSALARRTGSGIHVPLTPVAAAGGVVATFGALRLRARRRQRYRRVTRTRGKFSLPPL
jgi:D-alanyl-D-alanine carboxypeptidase (penicillin-binding protein 5/6)